MDEEIRSICPKCGKEGRQNIFTNGNARYLRFIHGAREVHYIGRIGNPGEGMGILNKPQSIEEYEKAMDNISKQLRELADYYSGSKSGSAVKLARSIQEILMNYGY
jgi:hypothetical protein